MIVYRPKFCSLETKNGELDNYGDNKKIKETSWSGLTFFKRNGNRPDYQSLFIKGARASRQNLTGKNRD